MILYQEQSQPTPDPDAKIAEYYRSVEVDIIPALGKQLGDLELPEFESSDSEIATAIREIFEDRYRCNAILRNVASVYSYSKSDLLELLGLMNLVSPISSICLESITPDESPLARAYEYRNYTAITLFLDLLVQDDNISGIVNFHRLMEQEGNSLIEEYFHFKAADVIKSGALKDYHIQLSKFGCDYIFQDYAIFDAVQQFGPLYKFSGTNRSYQVETYDLSGRKNTRPNDRTAVIGLRQGFFAVQGVGRGALIVRNSSPEFDRTKLNFTAAYIPEDRAQFFSSNKILDFPRTVEFVSTDVMKINPVANEFLHVNILLDELFGFLREYDRFKFDTSATTAWNHSEERSAPELVGAYRSEGFSYFTNNLRLFHNYYSQLGDKSMALGFVARDYTAFQTIPFVTPEGGRQRFLYVTDELVDVMQDLADDNATESAMIQSGLRDFFQMGLAQQASLTMFLKEY
ncbi:MAG: hypothetical protein KDD62_11130 [Bdellovibrionales bacterium]|nr:hypothetical protein [Bdellovibrionales bacterium]